MVFHPGHYIEQAGPHVGQLDRSQGTLGQPRRGQYRLPDVVIFDLSVQKDFTLGKWGIVTGIVDVTNVLDNQVAIARNELEGPAFGRDEDWVPPRVISLQLKYNF